MTAGKQGLLLVNLGTPDAPEAPAVRRYLREFLSDPRVLDLPRLGRWLLLYGIILPFRPAKSAAAYRKIWTEKGSPLLFHSQALTEALRERLQGRYEVELAMRYGSPSLPSALARLRERGVTHFTVLPLYPQAAASSTSSTLDRVYELLGKAWDVAPVRVVPPFFDQPGFLDAFTEVARAPLQGFQADHLLFSFHGLPERHMRKSDPTGQHCLTHEQCCAPGSKGTSFCYRAQCYATARALAQRLDVPEARYSVSFQSRLGRSPWVKPYTDFVLPELAQRGIKRLAVMCPAFVADCLETLEEVGLRAREQFKAGGGEELLLIPSLNAHPAWVDAVAQWVEAPPAA